MVKCTTQGFIAKAKKVHGKTFDYSRVVYLTSNKKVTILCKEHGPFQITPNNHLRYTSGTGCPVCKRPYSTWKSFVQAACAIHGDTYQYLKRLNVDKGTKATITCKLHGNFVQLRSNHVGRECECPKCAAKSRAAKQSSSHTDYLEKLQALGTKTVPLETYRSAKQVIKHQCGRCATVWNISPGRLLNSKGICKECNRAKQIEKQMLTHTEILSRLREVHGTKVQLIGQYRGMNVSHRLRCNSCMRTWKAGLGNVLHRKSGCPSCATQTPLRIKNGRSSFKFKLFEVDGQVFKVQGYEPQGIKWILRNHPKIKATDIKVDSSGDVPTIRYKIGRRNRTYFPDIFIPKLNRIVEIKSTYTLGLDTGRDWKRNQEKAKAVIAAGYKFSLLVLNADGFKLFTLPKQWYTMSRQAVLLHIAFHKADVVPTGVKQDKCSYLKVSNSAKEDTVAFLSDKIVDCVRDARSKGDRSTPATKLVAAAIKRYIPS